MICLLAVIISASGGKLRLRQFRKSASLRSVILKLCSLLQHRHDILETLHLALYGSSSFLDIETSFLRDSSAVLMMKQLEKYVARHAEAPNHRNSLTSLMCEPSYPNKVCLISGLA